jgi:16S rRNA C967 or C1407 C5-methylase (RsmB/RsmF family)
MHKRLRSLFLITLLGSSTTLYAAPMKTESLEKLIQLSNVEDFLKNSTTEMRPVFDQQAELIIKQSLNIEQLNPKQQQAAQQLGQLMFAKNQELMQNPKFMHMIKNVYQKTYSEEEAQAYITFLSSPLGQSISKKTIKLTSEMMQQSTQIAAELYNDPAQQKDFMLQLSKIITPLTEQQKAKK